MASIQRIKSPLTGEISYRVQVRVKGRPSESETFTSLKNAKSYAASLESAIEDGRHFPTRAAKRTAFSALVQRYRESVMSEVRTSNKVTREQHLEWWLKRFGAKTLAEVTPDQVAE